MAHPVQHPIQHPVQKQPSAAGQTPLEPWGVNWMQNLPILANCPPGLQYLTQVDQILCHQVVESLQVFTASKNKYVIKNSLGQQIFFAFEDSELCMKICCGTNREFTMHIVDNFNQEAMRIYRPFVCMGGCCWFANCCGHAVQVEAPPGHIIGIVKQRQSACTFDFDICDASGNPQLIIEGPLCSYQCCSDVEFPVFTKDRYRKIGSVTMQWTGLAEEFFTDTENFGITFPIDLDVRTKATLLGAMFLIDFMAFEKNKKNSSMIAL